MFDTPLIAAMFALGLMNCKNVTLPAHDPDPQLNRERRKAGVPPFVRYHTITIDPSKSIRRADGDAETTGGKKAAHTVRGHFVTYSTERPLFGRYAGTFWKPSYDRGSVELGIIDSDYRVVPPKPPEAPPASPDLI